MNIVTALPPSDRQSTAEVCDKDADYRIRGEVPRNAAMTCIVRSEHDLVPKETKEACRNHVPAVIQGENKNGKKCRVPDHFLAIFDEATLVEAFILDPLVQCLEFNGDVALRIGIERRVSFGVEIDFLLDGGRDVLSPGVNTIDI